MGLSNVDLKKTRKLQNAAMLVFFVTSGVVVGKP